MTLPSNSSMNYSPNNTASQFTTKLNEVVELDGNWEVGLLEVSFPDKVENVNSDDFYYYMLQENGELSRTVLLLYFIRDDGSGSRTSRVLQHWTSVACQ